jgi:hypothetical protein
VCTMEKKIQKILLSFRFLLTRTLTLIRIDLPQNRVKKNSLLHSPSPRKVLNGSDERICQRLKAVISG